MQPLILDLDDSVGSLPSEIRIPLRDWHDRLRFACSERQLRAFRNVLATTLPAQHGTVFFGSGDFHHLSLPLIERAAASAAQSVHVVVFDNHPDNMRFPFGVHCGSWVSRVAALPKVQRVDVVGITSRDIAFAHAWENRLRPLYRGKLRYWSIGVDTGWASAMGLAHAFRNFDTAEAMMTTLLHELDAIASPFYLSIDKDVLDPVDACTNWDQGCLRTTHLQAVIALLRNRRRLIGSDVNGEVSLARYPQWWKRMLSAVDSQPAPDADTLKGFQLQQHAVNAALWESFSA